MQRYHVSHSCFLPPRLLFILSLRPSAAMFFLNMSHKYQSVLVITPRPRKTSGPKEKRPRKACSHYDHYFFLLHTLPITLNRSQQQLSAYTYLFLIIVIGGELRSKDWHRIPGTCTVLYVRFDLPIDGVSEPIANRYRLDRERYSAHLVACLCFASCSTRSRPTRVCCGNPSRS